MGLCALLLAYMLGLLALTVALDVEYSVWQWLVIAALIAGAATLLIWQTWNAWAMRANQGQDHDPGRR